MNRGREELICIVDLDQFAAQISDDVLVPVPSRVQGSPVIDRQLPQLSIPIP